MALLDTLMLAREGVDRCAERRSDEGWLAARRADPASRQFRVNGGGAPVLVEGDRVRLALGPVGDGEAAFLGVDADDVAYFCSFAAERGEDDVWGELRTVGGQLDDRDAGLLVTAVALDNWRATHTRCPRCGVPTVSREGGWSRRCPDDDSLHFPRTDPAVIVLVRDGDDRALLGRQGRWQEGWFSTLAGFVEPGESAEAAVRREVLEESGVVIGDGRRRRRVPRAASPGRSRLADARLPRAGVGHDGHGRRLEIAEAHWFSRDELAAACEAGTVRLPPDISIARRLIERWYGGELPGDWSRPLGLKR